MTWGPSSWRNHSTYPLVDGFIPIEIHHVQWKNPLHIAILHSYVGHYQRVHPIHISLDHYKIPLNKIPWNSVKQRPSSITSKPTTGPSRVSSLSSRRCWWPCVWCTCGYTISGGCSWRVSKFYIEFMWNRYVHVCVCVFWFMSIYVSNSLLMSLSMCLNVFQSVYMCIYLCV